MKSPSSLYDPTHRGITCRALLEPRMVMVGDVYEEAVWTDYLADYEGYGRQFAPTSIFEIGVRYGYSGIAMCVGARSRISSFSYFGIDDESYHGGSCTVANANFAAVLTDPAVRAQAHRWNSLTQPLPVDRAPFDLIHIDGNHDEEPVLSDLRKSWPLLLPGGHLVLDDATEGGPIWRATMRFLAEAGEDAYEWQYHPNLRDHLILRKVGAC